MLYWLIPVGIIVGITVLILVWMILSCNNLIILQKYAERTLPLINVKIKDYTKKVIRFLDIVKENNEKEYEDINKLIEKNDNIQDTIKKLTIYRKIVEKVNKIVKNLDVENEVEELKELLKQMDTINLNLNKIVQRRNRAANFYNKKITTWPSKWLAERFKFEEQKSC